MRKRSQPMVRMKPSVPMRSLVYEGSEANEVAADLDVTEQEPVHLIVAKVTTLAGPVSADEHRATDHVVSFHILYYNPIMGGMEVAETSFFDFFRIVTIGAVL